MIFLAGRVGCVRCAVQRMLIAPIVGSLICQNCLENHVFQTRFGLEWIFDGLWMVLGAILGTILEQNRKQKSIQKMIRFLIDFERVLAPFGEPKGTKIAQNSLKWEPQIGSVRRT